MAKRIKVGLALSGGAAKGLANIGVLQVLKRENIPIDIIAGVSMGAMVGALYALGKEPDALMKLAVDLGPGSWRLFASPALSKSGLVGTGPLEKMLRPLIGNARFEDLRLPFACVTAEIHTGEEVIIKEGSLWEAVRATASIPVVFPVARWRDRHLVDGSLVNPVPVSVVRELGADFVIATVTTRESRRERRDMPTLLGVVMNTIYLLNQRLIRLSLAGADTIIEPNIDDIGFFDFHRASECIEEGKAATEAAMPEIKRQYLAMTGVA